MPKKSKKSPSKTHDVTVKHMSAKQLGKLFVLWYIAHAIIINLANRFFPEAIVLGTHFYSPWQSLLYATTVFTLITVGAVPVIEYVEEMQQRIFSTMDWVIIYFVINTAGLWVVARFAEQLGMGISSWVVAVIMALIIDVVQGFIAMSTTMRK